jgi:hypothetical protein
MHDWTRVKAGTCHNFHYRWIAALMDRLNGGMLPSGFFAMAEQDIGGPESDVLTLQTGSRPRRPETCNGGVAVARPRPTTRFVFPLERERYARKTHRIAIHQELGEVVAVIEIVSPGNKDRKRALQTFVKKAVEMIDQGVSLLVVDPFPPGRHDPQGVHKAIWDEFTDLPFELPPDKPLTLAAYQVEPIKTAFVEPIAVSDRLPDMPLFLCDEVYVSVPLEESYQATWNVLPAELRRLLE